MSEDQVSDGTGFFYPEDTILISRNLYLFLKDYAQVIELFFFTMHLAHRADEVMVIASKVLIKSANEDSAKERYQSAIDNPDRMKQKLYEFSRVNSRNLTVNIVDAFLWFISATIQAAMKKRPELVKSGESIKVEDIFDYRNKRELIDYLIDRKVNSLSYGGMSRIEKFIDDAMGVKLFASNEDRELMQIFVEVRNIEVHNRGIVNRVFLSRIVQNNSFDFVEGKRAHLDFDELVRLTGVCVKTAIEIDDRICAKFGIKRKRYSTWKNKA